MPGKVQLMRCPIDTVCGDCQKSLFFGVWVYYNADTGDAICPECGVKRGWTSKQRVKQLIKALELKTDIVALRRQRKIESTKLMILKQQINMHKLGERDLDIEKGIIELMDTVQDYLHHCGTEKEADAFNQMLNAMRQNQELQKEIREEINNWMFLIGKEKKKLKPEQKIVV